MFDMTRKIYLWELKRHFVVDFRVWFWNLSLKLFPQATSSIILLNRSISNVNHNIFDLGCYLDESFESWLLFVATRISLRNLYSRIIIVNYFISNKKP